MPTPHSGQPHRRDREARDPFGSAGKAEPLGRRRFDGDAADVEAGDLGDAGAHRLAVRADLRRFADERRVEMDDRAARGVGDFAGAICEASAGAAGECARSGGETVRDIERDIFLSKTEIDAMIFSDDKSDPWMAPTRCLAAGRRERTSA